MPGKKRECNGCGKLMRSDNLKNHKKVCRGLQSMAKTYDCEKCHQTFGSSQALWNHKQHCTENSKQNTFQKITEMIGNRSHVDIPPMKKSLALQPELKRQLKAEGKGMESVTADQNLLKKITLPQTIDDLLDRLADILDELREGGDISALKLEMIAIVHKLKDKNALKQEECDEICKNIEACHSENTSDDEKTNSEDDSEDSSEEDVNIYQLIDQTVEKLTENLRENLTELIPKVNETLRDKIKAFLNGEEVGENVKIMLDNDVLSAKIGVLINEIERVKRRVKNVLHQLQNIPDDDVIKTLESLRMNQQINEEQFKRMAIAKNKISDYSRAMIGKGLWLGRP